MNHERLPIDAVLAPLCAGLREHPALLLRAPTGAGKTTRVPGALLDAGVAGTGEVIVLEPRRLAARAAARRCAHERSTPLGQEVGYQVRFDSKRSENTRLCFMTEGLFLRRLQGDPFLEGVGLVIFDEFHERHLDGDLALALVRRVQLEAREDLKLLLMSATLAVEPLLDFLGSPPLVESLGRTYPVEIQYLAASERPERGLPTAQTVRHAIRRALNESSGDVLAFLPGVGEIRACHELIHSELQRAGHLMFELYGDLSPEEQDRALERHAGRAVFLATNVAETSITLPGVTAVVDSGLVRELRHDSVLGLNRLTVAPISRASAEQRAGRAGRTAPGICYRLWTEADQRSRAPEAEPEVRRIDVSAALLQVCLWGESRPAEFPWFENPGSASVESALQLLERLGAISRDAHGHCRLLEVGQQLAQLPLHPRLARLYLAGSRAGVGQQAATAAALLSERSPFLRGGRDELTFDAGVDSDLIDRVRALSDYEASGRTRSTAGELHVGGAQRLLRVRDQLLRNSISGSTTQSLSSADREQTPDERLAHALLAAYPDRVARRRAPGDLRAKMVGGRGVRLARESNVREAELFLCIEAAPQREESLVHLASEVRREWLPAERITTTTQLRFDDESERVVAETVTSYEDLVLDVRSAQLQRDEVSSQVLRRAAESDPKRALALDQPDLVALIARVHCLGGWMQDLELPRIEENFWRERLGDLCREKLSFAEVRGQSLVKTLRNALTWKHLEALDRHAPERIELPSGNRIALKYEEGRPPVLAARIQELFGWVETPRLAAGRVPVLLHLLGPNYRPQQVTEDLGSFWDNTYPVVRKELRRRYPKHAWPDDPRQAVARRRGR